MKPIAQDYDYVVGNEVELPGKFLYDVVKL